MPDKRFRVDRGPYKDDSLTWSFGSGPTPLAAIDCPRCPNGSPTAGTFTQTFNGVRHRSQKCAAYANHRAETLDDLIASRDELAGVESEDP